MSYLPVSNLASASNPSLACSTIYPSGCRSISTLWQTRGSSSTIRMYRVWTVRTFITLKKQQKPCLFGAERQASGVDDFWLLPAGLCIIFGREPVHEPHRERRGQ